MIQWFILTSEFLYFPEDKREYIPALISLAIFVITAILTMKWIMVISKREASKAKELEKKLKHNENKNWNS